MSISVSLSELWERHLNYETIWSGMLNVCAPSACITETSKTRCIIQHSGAAWAKLYFRQCRIVYLWRCWERERGNPHTLNWLTAQERGKFIFDQKQWPIIHLSGDIPREKLFMHDCYAHRWKKLDVVIFGIYYGTKTTSCTFITKLSP